ncbi:unnamed protein product [Pleuronectes platessa]|uniref:Uncharacterized protein n=1 Tax=Pleuronectes platessa TaxID=8262 RepID=A0A9N7VKF3_PLEPL|nr:unnamed protein product [Pleuronectes platessa]
MLTGSGTDPGLLKHRNCEFADGGTKAENSRSLGVYISQNLILLLVPSSQSAVRVCLTNSPLLAQLSLFRPSVLPHLCSPPRPGKGFHPHRRVTFSTANPVQDLQDASQHSYYDSGLEESETPSSKSSSGPRIGPLTLPEDHYERTTPDGSIGETEHPENDNAVFTQSSASLSSWTRVVLQLRCAGAINPQGDH